MGLQGVDVEGDGLQAAAGDVDEMSGRSVAGAAPIVQNVLALERIEIERRHSTSGFRIPWNNGEQNRPAAREDLGSQ